MQIRTVLVPYNFSVSAEDAFTWALTLAERWSAKVVVMHVALLSTHPSYP